jgi:hypothetical protein
MWTAECSKSKSCYREVVSMTATYAAMGSLADLLTSGGWCAVPIIDVAWMGIRCEPLYNGDQMN